MRKIAIPLGLVLLNFVLKILFLDSRSIWGDEAFSIFFAQMDIPSMIAQFSHENNPPLFVILLHYWIKCFGISPFSVRFLPLLFSSLTVYFIYQTGIRFFNQRIALVASLIFTFSSYTTLFAHETRAYSLLALLSTISMYAFFNIIKNNRRQLYFVILIAANILLSYTHFWGLFIPAIQLLCCIIFPPLRKEKLLLILGACLLLAMAYLPYLKVFMDRFHTSVKNGTWLRPIDFDSAYLMIWSFSNQPVVAVIFLCTLLIGLSKLVGRRGEYVSIYAKITTVWFIVPFSLMFLISLKYLPFNIPVFQDRYLIFTSNAFFLLIAITFDYISDAKWYRMVMPPLPVALMLFTCTLDPDNKMHISDAVKKVQELKTKNTIVYISPGYYSANFTYYYDRRYFKLYDADTVYRRVDSCLSIQKIFPIYSDREIDTTMADSADNIIFFDAVSDFLMPDNHINLYLSSHYHLIGRYNYPAVYTISVFGKRLEKP